MKCSGHDSALGAADDDVFWRQVSLPSVDAVPSAASVVCVLQQTPMEVPLIFGAPIPCGGIRFPRAIHVHVQGCVELGRTAGGQTACSLVPRDSWPTGAGFLSLTEVGMVQGGAGAGVSSVWHRR